MTDTIKYSLGVLGLVVLLFFYNRSSQNKNTYEGQKIFAGNDDDVYRIVITENDKEIELVKIDTSWSLSQADSFVVKENQLQKIFDRLLKVERELLITSKKEKWEKFGVDDSLGRHIVVYDQNDKELLHYIFGNSGTDWQHNYIRKNNSSDVYRTNDNVYFLLNTNMSYWGQKPPDPKPQDEAEE